jgi:methionyl-tRNA formyltransferase
MKKIGIVGCKHTTLEFLEGLEQIDIKVDYVITILPSKGKSQKVAGYLDLRPFLKEKGIECVIANKYSLKSEQDEIRMKDLKVDMLLVIGWQRLIPSWFLASLTIGAFGMHGSNKPLPHGRGRSPLNWSLIQNKKMFFTHLFQYKPGVDDGDIVDVQTFDITPFDDCRTLHYKNLLSMIKICEKNIPLLLDKAVEIRPQADIEPSYYPKRTKEDGVIYWKKASEDIYNLVRAVTRPFPGAFTFLDKIEIIIWKAIPFDTHLNWLKATFGEIIFVFHNGDFIVKTGDTSLLVSDYQNYKMTSLDVGKIFHHNNIPEKNWGNLPN